MAADGTRVRRLTYTPNQINEYPTWSPNSRRITYASTQGVAYAGESRALWIMNADGMAKKQLTRGAGDMYAAWSPNGKTICLPKQPRDARAALQEHIHDDAQTEADQANRDVPLRASVLVA